MSARAALLALAVALAVPSPSRTLEAPAPDAAQVQTLFDKGVAAAGAGRHDEAIKALYAALEALRAQGRIDGPDAGLVASRLARSLEATGHKQTDEAYELAVRSLEHAGDARPFAESAAALLRRRLAANEADKAAWVAGKLLDRVTREGVPEDVRAEATGAVIGYYNRSGRQELAEKAFDTLAELTGESAEISDWRGLALLRRAQRAQGEGQIQVARALIARAIPDLRRSGDRKMLATALISQGRLDYMDGAYRAALPIFAVAAGLLRPRPKETRLWVEAMGFHARLLERLDRTAEALAVADDMAAEIGKRDGDDRIMAAAARLDRAHYLLRAGKSAEARDLLKAEAERHGDNTDPFIAGLFYDRLAGARIDAQDYEGARDAAAESLRIFRKYKPDEPAHQLEPARKLAEALSARDDHAATETAMKTMIEAAEKVFSPGHPEVARDLNAYALFLRARDRLPETEQVQRRVIDILARSYGEVSPKYAFALTNLGVTLIERDSAGEATVLLQRAADILETAKGPEKDRIGVLASLAGAYRAMGQPRDALNALNRAMKIVEATPNLPISFDLTMLIDGNAVAALYDLGAYDEAWRIGSDLLKRRKLASHEDAANFNNLLMVVSLVAAARGQPGEALALTRQAGAAARVIGQTSRNFTGEWAGLLALYAWENAK